MAKNQNNNKSGNSGQPQMPQLNPSADITAGITSGMKTTPTLIGKGNIAGPANELAGRLDLIGSNFAALPGTPIGNLYTYAQEQYASKTKGPNKAIFNATLTINNLQPQLDALIAKRDSGTATKSELNRIKALTKQIGAQNKIITTNQGKVDAWDKTFNDFKAKNVTSDTTNIDLINEKFPEAKIAYEAAKPILAKMGTLGPEGEALMSALNKGYTAGTITATPAQAAQMGQIANISADQIRASRMGDFGSANAINAANVANVETGQLGSSLMNEAMRRVDLRGALDSQATRDAIQSARQGFAARGLVTGNAALGAELLNRDRYQRQRSMEDLQFAQGIQGQDLSRQFQNQQTQTQLSLANQQAAMQAELANLDARYKAAVQQGDWEQAAAVANQKANLDAAAQNQDTAFRVGSFNVDQQNQTNRFNAGLDLDMQTRNEEARRLGTAMNTGMLGEAFTTSKGLNAEALNAIGLGQSLATAANPNATLLNMFNAGQPAGSQAVGPVTNAAIAGAELNTANAWNSYNAQNYNWALQKYGNYGNQQSGGQSIWPGLVQTGAQVLGTALGSFGGPAGSAAGSTAGNIFGRYAASKMP